MMKKRGERVLGPYEQHNGWRVITFDDRGERAARLFDTEKAATYCLDCGAKLPHHCEGVPGGSGDD